MSDDLRLAETYIEGVGADEDRLLNAALGGVPNETISTRFARARAAGKRWGCIGCAILGRLVEPDHCDKVLAPTYRFTHHSLERLVILFGLLTALLVVLADRLIEGTVRLLEALLMRLV